MAQGRDRDHHAGRQFVVAYPIEKDVGDIKPDGYIAPTGFKGTGGKLQEIEARIFPESLRRRRYPRDLMLDSVMTNAAVGTATQLQQSNAIKGCYKPAFPGAEASGRAAAARCAVTTPASPTRRRAGASPAAS
jgi:hypothetical protein